MQCVYDDRPQKRPTEVVSFCRMALQRRLFSFFILTFGFSYVILLPSMHYE